MAIQIGCGSWADPEYVGLLYPPGFPPKLRLSGYAMWFDHVEVNSTYYSTPKKEAVEKWIAITPPNFQFDIRLHRAISQGPEKAAKEGRLLNFTLEALEPLFREKRFGTFLSVLSPTFSPDRHRLEELDGLIEKIRPHSLSIELRHNAWVTNETRKSTFDFFRSRQVTLVAVDMPQLKDSSLMPPIDEVTQPQLAYLRLHGHNPKYLAAKSAEERHAYAYTDEDLDIVMKRIRILASQAQNVRVVANNHASDFAPITALALRQRLGQI
jgi:uncharacterized protein YecE (DUF72 family)